MKKKGAKPRCDRCKEPDCRDGKDCFSIKEETLARFRGDEKMKKTALAHNPLGAIYCPYVLRRMEEGTFSE